jgi:hypothetical protein
LAAESDDIRLIQEELVGSLPIEMLGSAMSQAKHVGPDVFHRVQVAAVLGRKRAGQAALEIGGRPQHGGWIGDADGV